MAISRKQRCIFVVVACFCISFLLLIPVRDITATHWRPLKGDKLDLNKQDDSGFKEELVNMYTSIENHCVLTEYDARGSKQYDLRVLIITFNRPESLLRLIKSLDMADYGDANVMLEVWVDRTKSQLVHNETLYALTQSRFTKGLCNIIVHPFHVGIRGQWLATWNPSPGSSEIAVILEDDLTVSPHFYTYLKMVHKKYDHRKDVYGYSLQGVSVRHSDGKCCLEVPFENKVFLYPTLGTSGFSPKTSHWVEFQNWLKYILISQVKVPLIENHIAAHWYKELSKKNKEDSMWEMEYLYYTDKLKQYTLYPNFAGHRGLTFNWYEAGLHSSGKEKTNSNDEKKKLVFDLNITTNYLPENPVHVNINGDIISEGNKVNTVRK